jgi:hypothetical protein
MYISSAMSPLVISLIAFLNKWCSPFDLNDNLAEVWLSLKIILPVDPTSFSKHSQKFWGNPND